MTVTLESLALERAISELRWRGRVDQAPEVAVLYLRACARAGMGPAAALEQTIGGGEAPSGVTWQEALVLVEDWRSICVAAPEGGMAAR